MRLFLKRFAIFLCLMALFASVVDFLFSRRAQQAARPSIEGWYNLMYGKFDADCIIMGSSRAKNHIVPDVLDSVLNTSYYNLGMSGTRIKQQLAAYDLYRIRHRKPDTILFCIDVFTLIPSSRIADRSQYFPFFWDRAFRKKLFPIIHPTFSERFIPLYRYYSGEVTDLLTRYPKNLKKGYFPIDDPWLSPQIDSVPFDIDGHLQAVFEQFLDKAERERTQLVFILPPLYYEKARRIRDLDRMLGYYTDIGKKYHIPLLNYYFSDVSRDSSHFADPNHLNELGAMVFSDTLARDLKRLHGDLQPSK